MKKRKSLSDLFAESKSSDSELQFHRKIKSAENDAKLAKGKLDASEKEVARLKQQIGVYASLEGTRPKRISKTPSNAKGQASCVLLMSDWHVEELVDPAKVNYLNKYTLEIADQSISEVFRRSVMLLNHERQLADIKEVVVWFGGDFFSSFLHDELVEENQLHPLEATRWCMERMQGGIDLLAADPKTEKLRVVTSWGNHSRLTKKRHIATGAENSLEYNMYRMMEALNKNPKIEWVVGTGYHNIIEVQGKVCRFHHGDAMKYHGAIGGVTTTIEKAIKAWDSEIKADYTFSGHFHQFRAAPHWVSNGSLIGMNPFAIEIKASFEEPSQTFCVIDKDRGMTVVKKLFCRPPYRKAKWRIR